MYTVDTNVIIYYLQGNSEAVAFFDRAAEEQIPVYVSGISETELLSFPLLTENDIHAIEDVLAFCSVVHTNTRITRLAAALRRAHKIKTLDALIAATALFTSSTLITRNTRDFKRIPNLAVEKI